MRQVLYSPSILILGEWLKNLYSDKVRSIYSLDTVEINGQEKILS